MTGLFLILALVLTVVYVNDAWRSLERARGIARDVCAREGLQFLDGSVVQAGVRLQRHLGRIVLVRRYRFEFATDGSTRHQGELSLRGRRLQALSLSLPEGGRVVESGSGAARNDLP